MTPTETAAQLRLAADWIEKNMPDQPKSAKLTPELAAKGYEQYGFGPGITVVEQPDEIPWIEWHGGPCPLKDEEVEEWEYKFDSGVHIKEPCEKPSAYNWGMDGDGILAYRVLKTRTPKPKVPLGPEDVLPGSIFIVPTRKPSTWHAVTGVYEDCVQLDHGDFPFDELMEDGWQINRSIPQTGKWNPDAWESCEK